MASGDRSDGRAPSACEEGLRGAVDKHSPMGRNTEELAGKAAECERPRHQTALCRKVQFATH